MVQFYKCLHSTSFLHIIITKFKLNVILSHTLKFFCPHFTIFQTFQKLMSKATLVRGFHEFFCLQSIKRSVFLLLCELCAGIHYWKAKIGWSTSFCNRMGFGRWCWSRIQNFQKRSSSRRTAAVSWFLLKGNLLGMVFVCLLRRHP